MPPVGFERTISGGERPQTYALDRAATGTGKYLVITVAKTLFMSRNKPEKCFDPFVSHLCAKRYLFRTRIFYHPDDGCGTLLRNVI